MSSNSPRDRVYATPREMIVDFAFDESVADVFPDMIRRSVPGYETVIGLMGLLAERYLREGTACYDLGCSLGASSLSVLHRIGDRRCRLIAVDTSEAMVNRCRERLSRERTEAEIEVVCADARTVPIENASFAMMNFTLQFIEPDERLSLLQKIHRGLLPGGALVLSEKICFAGTQEQEFFTELHHAFKRANGYSDLEISQKRSALENVLIPETLDTHRRRLFEAGFSQVEVWYQCLNFASLVAVK
jgi:tRNA (cmo5U34)-methyltransferase